MQQQKAQFRQMNNLFFFLAQNCFVWYNKFMKNSKYKLILFDLDDTLIDNRENIKFAFKKIVETLEKPYTDDEFERWLSFDRQYWNDFYAGKFEVPKKFNSSQEAYVVFARSLRYKLFFNDINLDAAIMLNEVYISALTEKVVAIDGAFETLEYLSNSYEIVIATNGPSLAVKGKLSKIGCEKFVSKYFSSDMTKGTVSKPEKAYFEELLDYVGFHDKNKILFVGNSLRKDVIGALNFGIDAVWFNSDSREGLEGIVPTYTINKLIELKNIL